MPRTIPSFRGRPLPLGAPAGRFNHGLRYEIEPEPTPEEREALLEVLRRRYEPEESRSAWSSAADEEQLYATTRPRSTLGAERA